MRTSARTIRRHVAVLQLRAQGLTQAEVARELNIHPQSVARIERRFRRGWHRLPTGVVLDALTAEYHQARTEGARARLLASLVTLVAEQLRLRRAELALDQLRAVPPEPDGAMDVARAGAVAAAAPDLDPARPDTWLNARTPLSPQALARVEAIFADIDHASST